MINENNGAHSPFSVAMASSPQHLDGPAAKPLAGTVICCTAIVPEVREHYAQVLNVMGAEHKVDLTADVTHLVVGSADTEKYKYVAKERGDVRVILPEWIEAARVLWMEGKEVDVEALDTQYRLPTLHGLKICITGFDDITFRTQLQKNVVENGGEYTGDLVRDVTHLIAAAPEGKKYTFGTQWGKKVVSLKWYKDTIQRRMQLDESTYHPSTPASQQGVGAWNRRFQPAVHLGKRSIDSQAEPEPPRKLRRTASARLGSQKDNLWTDIVSGMGPEVVTTNQATLKTAKSMPALHSDDSAGTRLQSSSHAVPVSDGYLVNHVFLVQRFPDEHMAKLRDILVSLGGSLVETLEQLRGCHVAENVMKILLVPSRLSQSSSIITADTSSDIEIVSEFWLERCMSLKAFLAPRTYQLGRPLPHMKHRPLTTMTISSTGFVGVELMHVAKVLRALGAIYEENLNSNVCLLVCNGNKTHSSKAQYAYTWKLPVVSENWLWDCLKQCRKPAVERHLVHFSGTLKDRNTSDEVIRAKVHPESRTPQLGERITEAVFPVDRGSGMRVSSAGKSVETSVNHRSNATEHKSRPGTDFWMHDDGSNIQDGGVQQPANLMEENKGHLLQSATRRGVPNGSPLEEISTNVVGNNAPSPSKSLKHLGTSLDGTNSFDPNKRPPPERSTSNVASKGAQIEAASSASVLDARVLNGEIQELLDLKAKVKAKQEDTTHGAIPAKKKRLFGRALSNLSNSSAKSISKLSRASSVDSVNTDGLGSEIGPENSHQSKGISSHEEDSVTFTGRAKSRLLEGKTPSLELGDAERWREEYPEQPEAPPLTQLVYDDPDDAIALREKLAAKRRERSRLGQKKGDPRPEISRAPPRIKDSDILANAGWGAGRRTRQKDKSPPGLKGF